MQNERDLTNYLRQRFDKPANLASAFMGEDCEVVDIGDRGRYLLASIDTSSEKADFPSDAPPFEMGYFSTALSLSDIAACGGRPFGILVSCSIPTYFWERMSDVYEGVNEAARDAGVLILGGDTNSGAELSLSVVSLGFVEKNRLLTRRTAKAGDLVGVTGELGRFNLGTTQYKDGKVVNYEVMLRQKAQIRAGELLSSSGVVTSCIDLPDGLAKSLVDNAPEGLGFLINDSQIPVELIREYAGRETAITNFALASYPAGDTELLFTVSESDRDAVEDSFRREDVRVHWIGRVDSEPGTRVLAGGHIITPTGQGFMHSFEGKQLFA